MAKSLNDFVSAVQPLIRDTTTGVVETNDIRDALNRCIRNLKNDEGIHGTKNLTDMKVFPTVYSYPEPSDFYDLINLSPSNRTIDFSLYTPDEFRQQLSREDNIIAIDSILGDEYLLISCGTAGNFVQLHNCDSLTANGTWAADTSTSDASNLTADSVTKKEGAGSLNFDVSASQSVNNYAAISNSTITAQDLSDYEDNGTLFLWVYIPAVTNISSVLVRWGSSSSDYWGGSATTQYNGVALRTGWNEIGVHWEDTTETGTPDASAVDFLYVRVVYSASQASDTDFRIDDIRMCQPEIMELDYYSTSFVENAAGTTRSDEFSATDDVSLLDDLDDDLLFWWALHEAYQIKELPNDRDWALGKFIELKPKFLARHGSDRKIPIKRYY